MNNKIETWMGNEDGSNIDFSIEVDAKESIELENLHSQESQSEINTKAVEKDIVEFTLSDTLSGIMKVDYAVAVASGIVSAAIDSICIGELSLKDARDWGEDKTNAFVIKVAKLCGFKGDDLDKAIRFMEDYGLAADKLTPDFGGGLQHHLRDFNHHFSIIGLCFSILTQFTGKGYGTDTKGRFIILDIKDTELIGKSFSEKIVFGTVNWFFHIVSDMAGSSGHAGGGTGVPGPIVSLMKEMSALPLFQNKEIHGKEISVWISKIFNGTLFAEWGADGKINKDTVVKFDFRTELGVAHEIVQQSIPVIINECLVRGFYLITRLRSELEQQEINSIQDLNKINIENIIPFKNKTVTRMLTVATGTFTVIDIADAAIRSGIKNKNIKNPKFWIDFVLRINIPGVGRFAIACRSDLAMIAQSSKDKKFEEEKKQAELEREITGLEAFFLSTDKARVLYSLEACMINHDINHTKKGKDVENKVAWRDKWLETINASFLDNPIQMLSTEDEAEVYYNIRQAILEGGDLRWIYLVAMEMSLFTPYFKIDADDDKLIKGLKYSYDYVEKVFCKMQNLVGYETVKQYKKVYDKYLQKLSGNNIKKIMGLAGAAIITALSGGMAFAFAPTIAVAIVGEGFAGIYGAALTSASLACIGGGAVAAGGLGMAGGTAIIAGGGAIVGLAGGGGASAITSMVLLSKDGYTLDSSAKLLTFCDVVLINILGDVQTVASTQENLIYKIAAINVDLEKTKMKLLSSGKSLKEDKKWINIAGQSVKYLEKTSRILTKLIAQGIKGKELLIGLNNSEKIEEE